jgi:ferrous iron transport protein B
MTAQSTRSAGASCHGDPAGPVGDVDAPVVALAGAPNVGKSTLFNALTGARRAVGNWPGTTVEVGRGSWPLRGAGRADGYGEDCAGGDRAGEVRLIDLPGAYSLDPMSPDEELTRALLLDLPAERPDLVVVVVSALHLARGLYLVSQLRETSRRLVVALTMNDVAARRGIVVDAVALSDAAGVPVVGLDPRKQEGMRALAGAVARSLDASAPKARVVGATSDGLEPDLDLELADDRFGWITDVVIAATTRSSTDRRSWSDRADRWVTSPVVGPLVFLAAMWLVFQVTTTVAAPLQNALASFFSGPVSRGATTLLGTVGLAHGWLQRFVCDGLIAGVGLLLTFVPLMALMFLLLGVLEDSGYMARAAVVADRAMRAMGLPGRAFLPLIVGFGCNVPAISATRALPDARHRTLTVLLVPFTSCSARLTVYVLVGSIFFPGDVGNVVFVMYLLSIVLVVLVGLALRRTLWRTMGSEPLILDLPPYQRPAVRLTAIVTWVRLRGFLHTAGGIIVGMMAFVWLLQAIPAHGTHRFGDVQVRDSVYAASARAVAPALRPAGFGDWHAAGALIVGFVAKEAVISSWAQTYATQRPPDARHPGALAAQVRADFGQSSGGHPLAAVWAFLAFLLAYTPCVATLAAQKREVGVRWTLFGLAVQLSVAWALAVAVFQIGRLLI